MQQHLQGLAKWVARGTAAAFLVLVLAGVAILIVIPRAVHGTALTVLTGSMTPDIPVGSIVIDRPVDPGTLHVGDIATYQKAPGVNEYITHRIVAINTKTNPVTFTFKGDANRGPDITPVPATAIRGRVWFHVPYLGAIRDSLQSHGARGIALLLAVLGLAGLALFQLFDAVRQSRRASTTTTDSKTATGSETLRLRFGSDVFSPGDASLVARLLHGDVEVADDGTTTLTFTGPAQRLAMIREHLEPHALQDDEPAPAARVLRMPRHRRSTDLQRAGHAHE